MTIDQARRRAEKALADFDPLNPTAESIARVDRAVHEVDKLQAKCEHQHQSHSRRGELRCMRCGFEVENTNE